MNPEKPPQDYQQEHREMQMAALTAAHPEVLPIVEELRNPDLSREEFFSIMDAFRTEHADQPARTGMYNDITFFIEEVPTRRVTVKWYKNGRVEIGGADHNA